MGFAKSSTHPTKIMRKYLLLTVLLLAATSVRAQSSFDEETDRRSDDDQRVRIRQPAPRLCQRACNQDETCRVWTFVRGGSADSGCWIGTRQQEAQPSECCVSGTAR